MGDNPKKKKRDSKRIALKQPHELRYMRNQCEVLIKLCEWELKIEGKRTTLPFWYGKQDTKDFSVSTIRRIAKAFLKATK